MILSSPENKYDIEMLKILTTNLEYSKMPDGEKGILYDLAHDITKYVPINWEKLNLDYYLYNIKLSYDKTKNRPMINVICACINNIFPKYRAKVKDKTLVIKDTSIS